MPYVLDMGSAIIIIFLVGLFLAPTFIAVGRNHHNCAAIFALNLCLGWTGLGWIAALIWSLTATRNAA